MKSSVPCTLLGSLLCAGLIPAALPAAEPTPPPAKSVTSVSNVELLRKLEALEAQNRVLAQKIEKLEAAQAQQAAQVQQQAVEAQQQRRLVADVQQQVTAPAAAPAVPAVVADNHASTSVGAYGEIEYTRPSRSPSDATVDVARAVILVHHSFDDKTRFNGEFEWEHAITSATDSGEAEVEQLWVERDLTSYVSARAGLFLMPVGLVNEHHEPNAFYGVQRPEVDTKIVPSTWREVGLGATGHTAQGLSWELALTTAPNLGKWDPGATEGAMRGPLQAIHGEGQFASFSDYGVLGALNWQGVPGLLVGGSVFYAGLGQHQPNFAGNGAKLLFLDAHARYQRAGWDFAGEYERGTITHTAALNADYVATFDSPTLVPHVFHGGYVQAAYEIWEAGDYSLSPFVRYEILNTAAGFASLPGGVGALTNPDEHIWTVGASFRIGEGVVLKSDYRHYRENPYPDADHFNLGTSFNFGVGFSF